MDGDALNVIEYLIKWASGSNTARFRSWSVESSIDGRSVDITMRETIAGPNGRRMCCARSVTVEQVTMARIDVLLEEAHNCARDNRGRIGRVGSGDAR